MLGESLKTSRTAARSPRSSLAKPIRPPPAPTGIRFVAHGETGSTDPLALRLSCRRYNECHRRYIGQPARAFWRFHRFQQEREDDRKVAAIILETGASPAEAERSVPARGSANGWHRQRARGIPIVGGVGGGGASPGTDPVAALLRKEARGELRL
jgi:hypothetical protein